MSETDRDETERLAKWADREAMAAYGDDLVDDPEDHEGAQVANLLRALLAAKEGAEAERDEARRRRDEWRKKAEGYDEVRRALREKVGEPWPPNMSRLLWAGIAADEKKRADDAEAEAAALREALHDAAPIIETWLRALAGQWGGA